MATKNSIDSNIPIEIAKGGTAASSMSTNYGVVYYDSSKLATVASVGTANQVLQSTGSSSAPAFADLSPTGAPITVAFQANLSSDATSVTGDGTAYTVLWDNEVYDIGGDFDTSTGVFTSSATGKCFFTASVNIYRDTAETNLLVTLSTSNRDYSVIGNTYVERFQYTVAYQYQCTQSVSQLCDMDVADTASIVVTLSDGTKNVDILSSGASYFCGYQPN